MIQQEKYFYKEIKKAIRIAVERFYDYDGGPIFSSYEEDKKMITKTIKSIFNEYKRMKINDKKFNEYKRMKIKDKKK